MNLLDLYRFAEEKDISVDDFPMHNRSLAVDFGGGEYGIALNESLLATSPEKKVALAHELGHCETASFYTLSNPLDLRRRHECRADRWAMRRLIPREDLENAIQSGVREVWDLAEYFGVTDEFMIKTIDYYRQQDLERLSEGFPSPLPGVSP
ncbi:MAG: ImmA/IrrE family metallo-endopeptidase [Oscillospiraceae bacterium]|nr:ImmA/IrrE family metallo-endopeptidase [Oscillospiraceae bacterium]MDY4191304.1 ImmA/IrrE family metallo-endopeptidase [Oscillospiraceae bacterium]